MMLALGDHDQAIRMYFIGSSGPSASS